MINNIKGHNETIRHQKATYFDETFRVDTVRLDTGAVSTYDLTLYNTLFNVYTKKGGAILYTKTDAGPEFTINAATFRLKDNFPITRTGTLYYEVISVLGSDAEQYVILMFGDFEHEQ